MNDEGKPYPISEVFTSPQGEGVWAGCLSTFVRLAGCTVGRKYPKERYQSRVDPIEGAHEIPGLPVYTEECTLWDGRNFSCDTDYRMKEKLTVDQILNQVPEDVRHVVITGGEPFMHDLRPLIVALMNKQKRVHIETSGTIYKDYKSAYSANGYPPWITVSPKWKCLPEMVGQADEIKLLVDEGFDPGNFSIQMLSHPNVFLQPVNGEHTVNGENLKLCMKWQKEYPNWRVSVQLHKVIEAFTKERVR